MRAKFSALDSSANPTTKEREIVSVKAADQLKDEFIEQWEKELAPGKASKEEYLEALENLISDLEIRADCVREEIATEAG